MISIVIPAYNEEKTIGKTLSSLAKQVHTESFEVIVVDNNSTDQTAKKAAEFSSQLALRVISEKKPGRGSARAAGFAAAKGDIICSTDADTMLPPDWLKKITEPFKDPAVVAVTGTSYITDCSPLTNTMYNKIQPTISILYKMVHRHNWFAGVNGAMRKSAYIAAGGFSTDLNAVEDVELATRLKEQGDIKLLLHVPVESSGRRFKKDPVQGLFSYVPPYVNLLLKRKKGHIVLKDIR